MTTMTYSSDGLKITEMFEGVRLEAYPDPSSGGDPWTIGYGHTGQHVKKGWVSEVEAEAILDEELKETRQIVLDTVKVKLTSSQLAALTSFTFNCGGGALKALVDQPGRLNDGNYESVERLMPMYRKAGGKVRKAGCKRGMGKAMRGY